MPTPDPVLAVLTVLRRAYPALPTSAKYSTARPSAVVACDTLDARDSRGLDSRAVVRITITASDPAEAFRLASTARSLLLSHPGDTLLGGCSALAGPIPTEDLATGEPVSFFTLEARLRPAVTL